MAIYRNIQMSFWTDTKVIDDFSPEDKYVYLYLMTNPHTNLCGCYELSMKQASIEIGYTPEAVRACLLRLEEVHSVIKYSDLTKEVLIINWGKYNWTNSKDVRRCLESEITNVKDEEFRGFLMHELDCGSISDYAFKDLSKEPSPPSLEDEGDSGETLSTGREDGGGTTDSLVYDSLVPKTKKIKTKKNSKHAYGEYGHVKLTDVEYTRLVNEYGENALLEGIQNVDEYCQEHGKKYSDYNLVLRKWGIKSPKLSDQVQKKATAPPHPSPEELEEKEWENLSDEEWEAKMRALDSPSQKLEDEYPYRLEDE